MGAMRHIAKIEGLGCDVRIVSNPGVGGVSDRAWRYRAVKNAPDPCPCYWCGRTKQPNGRPLEVAHIDGREEHVELENLGWTCRPCNVLVGSTLKNAGVSRLTEQYNPGRRRRNAGASSFPSWVYAVLVMRGDITGSAPAVRECMEVVKATNPAQRAKYARQLGLRVNPSKRPSGADTGARTLAQWAYAASVMRGHAVDENMTPQQAYELMMDTPKFWRSDYNRQLWKRRKARRGQ